MVLSVSKVWLTVLLEAQQRSSTFVLSSDEVFQALQQNHHGMFQLLIGGPLQVRQPHTSQHLCE